MKSFAMTWKNIFLVTAVLMAGAARLFAQSPLVISVDAARPGAAISPDFSGLSFEISQTLPAKSGVRYFSPDNQPLIHLFQTLGIKSLRVGGNTADRSAGQLPGKAEIDSLFAFARAAGVKIIYCLRLHDGDPGQDAEMAKYITDNYAAQLDCFSIGQEPNVYPKTTNSMGVITPRPSYADFKKKWKQFENVIVAQAPEANFCGPSVDDNPLWPREFMADYGLGNHVVLITAHLYPGRSGDKVPTPEIGRDQMLGDGFVQTYQKLYDGFVPAAISNNLPYRLEEVNNFFNGGATNVSDTFASALWGLDFMYWWAAHGAAGVNFHTGDKVAAGNELRPSKYTAYFSTTNGFLVRPLGYGIKAFDLGGHGRIVPAAISNPQNLNVSVYSVLGNDEHIYVTIINKEHRPGARNADVSLAAGAGFNHGQIISLTVPNGDVASKTGTTLGGAVVENDGSWNGKWTDLTPTGAGSFTIKIPAASAAIIKLQTD